MIKDTALFDELILNLMKVPKTDIKIVEINQVLKDYHQANDESLSKIDESSSKFVEISSNLLKLHQNL